MRIKHKRYTITSPFSPRLEAALKEAADSGLMEEEMVAAKVLMTEMGRRISETN